MRVLWGPCTGHAQDTFRACTRHAQGTPGHARSTLWAPTGRAEGVHRACSEHGPGMHRADSEGMPWACRGHAQGTHRACSSYARGMPRARAGPAQGMLRACRVCSCCSSPADLCAKGSFLTSRLLCWNSPCACVASSACTQAPVTSACGTGGGGGCRGCVAEHGASTVAEERHNSSVSSRRPHQSVLLRDVWSEPALCAPSPHHDNLPFGRARGGRGGHGREMADGRVLLNWGWIETLSSGGGGVPAG